MLSAKQVGWDKLAARQSVKAKSQRDGTWQERQRRQRIADARAELNAAEDRTRREELRARRGAYDAEAWLAHQWVEAGSERYLFASQSGTRLRLLTARVDALARGIPCDDAPSADAATWRRLQLKLARWIYDAAQRHGR